MKCTKCKIDKECEMFRKRKTLKSGYHSWCKDCESIANRNKYISRPRKISEVKDPAIIKLNSLKRMLQYRYSISYETYIAMYEEQNKLCKLCQTKNTLGGRRGLQIDHCHVSGRIRGLICPRCNRGMQFIDKIKKISIISDYLSENTIIL